MAAQLTRRQFPVQSFKSQVREERKKERALLQSPRAKLTMLVSLISVTLPLSPTLSRLDRGKKGLQSESATRCQKHFFFFFFFFSSSIAVVTQKVMPAPESPQWGLVSCMPFPGLSLFFPQVYLKAKRGNGTRGGMIRAPRVRNPLISIDCFEIGTEPRKGQEQRWGDIIII